MPGTEIAPGERGFVESGDEQIYFETWGRGEPVVQCHGMGGNHAIWFQQVPALAERHLVITWDQRGFGLSTSVTDTPGPHVPDLVAILDRLDLERAHVVGQSMGGWVGLGLAVTRPDRTASLTLADSIGGIYTSAIRRAILDFADVLRSDPPPSRLPLGFHPALGSQLAGQDLALAFLYGQIGGLGLSPSPAVITELLAATDHTECLADLEAPTLFVVGENDPIFPPGLITEAASLVEGSQVEIIADAGHSPYFERAGVWNRILLEFLANVA